MKWSSEEENVIRSLYDPPEKPRHVATLLLALPLAILLAALLATRAEAQERYTPSSRGELRELAYERAAVHGASGWQVWATVECEVRDLNPWAVGDGGTSFGLAQLNNQQWTGNLLGHFYSLGYTRWWSPWEALDYLARSFAGEFRGAAWGDIGPHRWTCYRLLFGGGR